MGKRRNGRVTKRTMSGIEEGDSIEEDDNTGRDTNGADFGHPSWLYEHIGRILGAFAGAVTLSALGLFISLGFRPALFILVFFLAGVILIILGGKIHQA